MFSSKTALSKLSLAPISKLNLSEIAKGKYVLARIINECFNVTAVSRSTVIEDHKGYKIGFVLYHYPLEDIIYLGDIIIIKEPYLCSPNPTLGCYFPTIACYSPTDLVVVRPSHPFYPKVKLTKWQTKVEVSKPLKDNFLPTTNLVQWISRGNEMFDNGQFILAREAYNMGLKMSSDNDPRVKEIHLNLLATQHRLGYYEWVVENGETFLRDYPEEYLAYFSVGKAYYVLRNYQKAFENFQQFCAKFKKNKTSLAKLEKAKARIREANGEFDFENLRQISSENPGQNMKCADFYGPVKVAEIPGKGRGLVLTEDVSEGSVLVVSKAVAVVLNHHWLIAEGVTPDSRFCMLFLVIQVARLIMKNPKTVGTHVYDLFSGTNYYTEPAHFFCDPELKNEPICDMELLCKIVALNMFLIDDGTQNVEFRACGLFLLPSYINHSCVPNVKTEFYNDVMVVKALEDMKEGTELTRSYVSPELSFEERKKYFVDRGFMCHCAKCEERR